MKQSLMVLLMAAYLAVACFPTTGIAATGQPPVGSPAPESELADQTGQLHSLEDCRSQWVVLYFYPRDETPGCIARAAEFRDNAFAFAALNAQIPGVSLHDIASHTACRQTLTPLSIARGL